MFNFKFRKKNKMNLKFKNFKNKMKNNGIMNAFQSKLNHLQKLQNSRNRYTQCIYLEQCREFVEQLIAADSLAGLNNASSEVDIADRCCCKATQDLYLDCNEQLQNSESKVIKMEQELVKLERENVAVDDEKRELTRRLVIMTLEYHKLYNRFLKCNNTIKEDLEDFILIEKKNQ
jgi:hypothetical protein